jgi:hypothetical protein
MAFALGELADLLHEGKRFPEIAESKQGSLAPPFAILPGPSRKTTKANHKLVSAAGECRGGKVSAKLREDHHLCDRLVRRLYC